MLRSESDWDGMGDPGPSMPPSGSTNSEELFKAFLADCEDASASREQTAPSEAMVSQERHPNPSPMPGVAVEAEQNPPFDWEGRPKSCGQFGQGHYKRAMLYDFALFTRVSDLHLPIYGFTREVELSLKLLRSVIHLRLPL